jgi:hypothetical protein
MVGFLVVLAFVSAVLFPWPLTGLLSFAIAPFEPLVPLALGLVLDALYFAPEAKVLPLFTLCGGVITIVAYLVRKRLRLTALQK